MSRRFLTLLALAFCLVCAPLAWADDAGVPAVVEVTGAPGLSGAGSSGAPLQVTDKTEALPNPAVAPVAAWDEVKVAKRTSWPLAIWAALAMLGKALAYGRDKLAKVPLVGKLATWLAKGKGAMVVAAIGAVGAAGYAVLIDGGSLVSALVASAVAIAGVTHSTTKTTGGTAPVSSPS